MYNLLLVGLLFISLQAPTRPPGQKHLHKRAKTTMRQIQSLCGTIVEKRGNQMPSPDKPSPAGHPVVREIAVFPLLSMGQVTSDDAGFITDLKGIKPLLTVQSGKDGKFCFGKLAAGLYSVLIHESRGWYANSFDGQNHINPVTVQVGKTTNVAMAITYQAAF